MFALGNVELKSLINSASTRRKQKFETKERKMKKIVAVFMLVALSGCVSATPVAQPTPTPKPDFFAGKPTLTPQVIELPKPQPKPPLEYVFFLSQKTFTNLPAEATQAKFSAPPWVKPDPARDTDPDLVPAIVWNTSDGNFYIYRIGSALNPGWNGPGYIDINDYMLMICTRSCNQWPVPVAFKIDMSTLPRQPSGASYPQPPWGPKRGVDPTMSDALVLDLVTGGRFTYRFPNFLRDEFVTGWYFGLIDLPARNPIGVCFSTCNVFVPKP